MTPKSNIPLTAAMRKQLLAHKEKTGCGASTLYRYMVDNELVPADAHLSLKKIESWYSGICKSVKPDEYEAVIAAYSKLPNKIISKCAHGRIGQRVPVCDNLRRRLELLAGRTNSMAALLRREGGPVGLTPAQLSNIKNGKFDTMLEEHAEFLERLFDQFNISE